MEKDSEDVKYMVQQNNRILHKLLNHQRYATFISLIKWAIILGTAFGAYYILQPYINNFVDIYNAIPGVSKLELPSFLQQTN